MLVLCINCFCNTSCFGNLFNFLDLIIKKIRNKEEVDIKNDIYNKLKCIFLDIINTINTTDNRPIN